LDLGPGSPRCPNTRGLQFCAAPRRLSSPAIEIDGLTPVTDRRPTDLPLAWWCCTATLPYGNREPARSSAGPMWLRLSLQLSPSRIRRANPRMQQKTGSHAVPARCLSNPLVGCPCECSCEWLDGLWVFHSVIYFPKQPSARTLCPLGHDQTSRRLRRALALQMRNDIGRQGPFSTAVSTPLPPWSTACFHAASLSTACLLHSIPVERPGQKHSPWPACLPAKLPLRMGDGSQAEDDMVVVPRQFVRQASVLHQSRNQPLAPNLISRDYPASQITV
jgi:hypothetical protein